MRRHEIADADWDRIKDLLPTHGPAAEDRTFVNAVPGVARTGAAWRDLPERLGHWNSQWRRFARRADAGVWQRVLDALRDPDLRGRIPASTTVRAHPAAAGARKTRTGPAAEATRRSAAAAAGSGPRSTRASTPPATRYDETARSFPAFVHVASVTVVMR
jgi:transposase